MIHILISACLLGDNCKYSGGNNYSESLSGFLEEMKGKIRVIPVCPEVMGGLDTPRLPAEIRNTGPEKRVFNQAGADVTKEFVMGAKKTLIKAEEQGCRYAILKEKSPSCGSVRIYDGSFRKITIEGMGLTAALLAEHGITVFHEGNYEKLRELL